MENSDWVVLLIIITFLLFIVISNLMENSGNISTPEEIYPHESSYIF